MFHFVGTNPLLSGLTIIDTDWKFLFGMEKLKLSELNVRELGHAIMVMRSSDQD